MTKPAQEKFYQQLGIRVRDARKAIGLKQEALASYLDLSRVSVVNIEKGRQHPPLHLLSDMARILKVDLCTLIPDSPSSETKSISNWEKIIGKKVKGDKQAQEKLLGFVNDLNTTK